MPNTIKESDSEIQENSLKIGEIFSFDSTEFFFLCSLCDKSFAISSLEFLEHCKDEFLARKEIKKENLENENVKDETLSEYSAGDNNVHFLSIDDIDQKDYYLEQHDELNKLEENLDDEDEIEINKIAQIKKGKKKIIQLKNLPPITASEEDDFVKSLCDLCEKSFHDIERHARLVHFINIDKPKWSCHACGFRSKTIEQARDHKNKHIGQTLYKCKVKNCNQLFVSRVEVKSHEQDHLMKLKCNQCGRKFKNDNLMKEHQCNAFTNYCNVCKVYYMQGTDFDYHECTLVKKAEEEGNPVFACNLCPKKFTTETRLEIHQILHKISKNKNDYQCFICCKQFKQYTGLKDHLQDHADTKFPCDKCDRVFVRRLQYVKHHNKDHLKRHQCRFCGKTHFSCTDKRIHELTHSNEGKTHQCYKCGKTFTVNKSLENHMNEVHFRKWEFKCEKCPKKFTSKRLLNEHLFRHNAVYNYNCDLCSKKYKTAQDLRRHKRIIHMKDKSFKCELCKKSFVILRNFKEHMKLHSNG